MRHKFTGIYRDSAGNVITSGTATVYLAGTITPASIYTSSTSTSAVNFVTTSTTDGSFDFYVDRFDYDRDQQFKIVLSKTGLTSKTYDYIEVDDLVSGTYTISADKTVSTNLGYIPKGVIYSVSSGITLTISGTFEAGLYQIFSGVGTVTISGKLNTIYPEWFGAKDDSGTTDNTAAITSALVSGGEIQFTAPNGGYYHITDTITVSVAGTKIYSNNKAEIKQATSNKGGFEVTASNLEISGLKLTGPQYAASASGEKAIYVYGADYSHYVTDIKITNCNINSWGYGGIWTLFVSDFDFSNNNIENIYYAAIMGLSSTQGMVTKNMIDNVVGTPNGYGIEFSRDEEDSTVAYPRSSKVTITDNKVSNVTYWKGIGTHGGSDLLIANNRVESCSIGIGVGSSQNSSAVSILAPLNVSVIGNIIDSNVTDGSASYGIFFTNAATAVEYGTGKILGNYVKGHGADATNGCAIWTYGTNGLDIAENTVYKPARIGISAYATAYAVTTLTIRNNTIYDAWSESLTVPVGVYVYAVSPSSINIYGNRSARGDSTATYTFAAGAGVHIKALTTGTVTVGENYIDGVKYALSDTAHIARKHYNTSISTSGTGEDNLASLTIPASTIGIEGGLRIIAAGTKTASNGNKTLKFYFGATAVTFHAAANNTNDWRFEATIFNTATNAQIISWIGYDGATPLQGYDTAAIDTTADVIVKITGECAHASDTITQLLYFVEKI